MLLEFSAAELLGADLALNLHLSAVPANVVAKLGASHGLEFGFVTDIASIFGALVVLSMLLELANCHPLDFALDDLVALVRELAEVDAVSHDWINVVEEVASVLAIRALHRVHSLAVARRALAGGRSLALTSSSVEFLVAWLLNGLLSPLFGVLLDQDLTVLAEYLMASLALEGHVGELVAHHAEHFLNQLSLQLVLDFVHFDIDRGHGLGAHDFVHGLLGDHQVSTSGHQTGDFVSRGSVARGGFGVA